MSNLLVFFTLMTGNMLNEADFKRILFDAMMNETWVIAMLNEQKTLEAQRMVRD